MIEPERFFRDRRNFIKTEMKRVKNEGCVEEWKGQNVQILFPINAIQFFLQTITLMQMTT